MKYVTYLRVSTKHQGENGLGIEAQRAACARLMSAHPGEWELMAEFVEVESGKKNDRPQLTAALELARKEKARLIVAKLDRLARNAAFLFSLMDAGVDFQAADNPDVTPLTARILAVIAQDEAERISARTKAALAAKKAQGAALGKPENLTDAAREKGREKVMKNAQNAPAWVQAAEYAALLRGKGMTLQAIADKLNEKGFLTRGGKQYQRATVSRLLDKVTA
jgi:DNA invertase Pin-like site-specific DNA recombinase